VTEPCYGKSHLFAKNESNFIFSLKTQAENVNPRFSGAVWFSALYNIPPDPGYAVRQSFVLLLLSDHSGQYNRRRVNRQRVMLVELWLGPVNPASFIDKSHAFKACFYLDN